MGEPQAINEIKGALGSRSLVMVGLMGCGKSAVGRRLATRLGLPFVDADEEIEKAAGKTIEDIFDEHGEPYFREGERKVLARLLRSGPQVLATGGGAFMNSETRDGHRRGRHLDVAQGRPRRFSFAASPSVATVRCSRTATPRSCCRRLSTLATRSMPRQTSRSRAATCRTR